MKLSIFSTLALAALTSAVPQSPAAGANKANCLGQELCCDELKTPADSTLKGTLDTLKVDPTTIVGSVGLKCKPYGKSCPSQPQCCKQANALNGLVGLDCHTVKSSSKPA